MALPNETSAYLALKEYVIPKKHLEKVKPWHFPVMHICNGCSQHPKTRGFEPFLRKTEEAEALELLPL